MKNQFERSKKENLEDLKEFNIKTSANLDYLFSVDLGKRICTFLDYKDLLNLRSVNKIINFVFTNDSSYYFMMAKKIRTKWLGIRNDLLKKLSKVIKLSSCYLEF